MKQRKTPYDKLPAIRFGNHPKVLLVGNGLNLSFDEAYSTDSIIQAEWKSHYGEDLLDRKNSKHEVWKLPFPLEVVAATKDHVHGCMGTLADVFNKMVVSPEQNALITNLMDAGADVILSTNYSLEFEKTAITGYTRNRNYAYYRTTQLQTAQQERFGIFRCTQLPYNNNPLLWHIHGTALRKDSMVMGQFYYGKLLAEVTERAKEVKSAYYASVKAEKDYHPKSWIDYFLIGDVHIFAFSLDYSESDLWWLISYKKSAFPESKAFFYSNHIASDKKLMLDCYDVSTPSIEFIEDEEYKYIEYYKRICASIK